MAVISVRLNKDEEGIIEYLSKIYNEDKSTLIKHSLREMYEDNLDIETIKNYESSNKEENGKFINSEEVIKSL
jgi:predicted transcriptional regulator